ncbi:Transcriptional regulator [Thecaphora frezii]
MGGKDSTLFSGRAARDSGSAAPGTPRSGSAVPFYRQFLPSQLASSSAGDPIPSLDELSALARYLGRVRSESTARLARLEARAEDPLRPIFSSSSYDLFSPPGLVSSVSGSSGLYSDHTTKSSASAPKYKSKERAFSLASPDPLPQSPSVHASPSAANGAQRHRIKIKRERDGESVPSTAGPSGAYADGKKDGTAAGGKAGPKAKAGRGQSAGVDDDDSVATTDPDWDLDEDSLPSRPGKARQKKRRRKGSGFDSLEEDSASDFDSIVPGTGTASTCRSGAAAGKNGTPSLASAASRPGSATGHASARASDASVGASSAAAANSKSAGFSMRLKVNPAGNATPGPTTMAAATATASPAIQRKDSEVTAGSTRRNSILPTPSPLPSTPQPPSAVTAPPVPTGPAPGWEPPARTPHSFLPVLAPSRLPRPYPTHPSEVSEDFANKDWKERERERDRLLERESAQPGTPGVGAGPNLVKEATTGRRGGRDQQQTPINTFYNYADAFFKTLTEDDLAWLSSKSDDTEPFQMPSLGRHYKHVWEEEDALAASSALELYGTPFSGSGPGHSRTPSISLGTGLPLDPLSTLSNGAQKAGSDSGNVDLDIPPPCRFKAKQMSDEHLCLGSEAAVDARSGPLAERLVSALLTKERPQHPTGDQIGAKISTSAEPKPADDNDNLEAGDEDAEGEPDAAFEGLLHDQDMVDFEERIKRELRAIDVLGAEEQVDWSSRADDEISTTLRMVQRALARQQKINGMRKARLFQIAMDRMAYQDYVICLNTVEKEIEAGWNKRLRQIKASLGKRKKAGGGNASNHEDGGGQSAAANGSSALQAPNGNGVAGGTGASQAGQTSAANYGPVRPQLPEALTAAMERRAKLQYAFGEMFDEAKYAWETPTESVYADLDLDKIE